MTERDLQLELERFRGRMDVTDEKIHSLEKRVETRMRRMEDRLTGIESNTSWIVRLIIGAVVLAALGILINGTIAAAQPIAMHYPSGTQI